MTTAVLTDQRRYPPVYFESTHMACEYIQQYMTDVPTAVTYAFGDIEVYRRIPYPYSRYGVTHSGAVFSWKNIEGRIDLYHKEISGGMMAYCGVTTDYLTREVIERGKLVLLAFYPEIIPMEYIFHIDGNVENDYMWNLEWADYTSHYLNINR